MGESPFGPGVRRICAVAAARTAAEMIAQVRAGLQETPTIELRLDWLGSDAERARMLAWVAKTVAPRARSRTRGINERARRTSLPVFIATCRRRQGGGRFRGSVEAQMRWLARAHEAGCAWSDVEVESWRTLPQAAAHGHPRLRSQAVALQLIGRVMVSLHDFRGTPRSPRALRRKLKQVIAKAETDAIKVATFAKTIIDSRRLLRVAEREKNCVAVPMGQIGLAGRILALREGSALAYAPVATVTAPGQISLPEFKHLYRAHELNRQTRVYGVVGNPVGHSLSPLMHNTAFTARKINAVYLPFLVKDLRDFLKAAPQFGVKGFSVTLPHKTTILRYLDECDALAAEIGAVNTVVVRRDGSLYGCNTDYVGVLRALERKFRIAGSRVLIYGAGGAARAVAFALERAGADVGICARRDSAARELARAVDGEVVLRRALRTERFDAVINTTPVGMYPHDKISPLEARELHCRIAMDLVNRPQHTKFLKIAASKGIETVPGVDMFVPQGVAQWEMWTGRRAPEGQMRRVVLDALRSEAQQRRPR